MKKLDGKVSIITGAGSGMGRAMALLFAEHGSSVVATDLHRSSLQDLEAEITAKGGTVATVVSDIARDDDIQAMFDTCLDSFGTLDVLVNNAGLMDDYHGAGEQPVEMWTRIMDINLNGPFKASRLAIGAMLASGKGGVIVNNASVCGFVGARAGAAYTASKHAILGLTKNTAFTYSTRGIRCNAICPGAVKTNIAQNSGYDSSSISEFTATVSVPARNLTNPRVADPMEIAQLGLFLASDDSSFVNGAVIAADGGWTSY